MKAPGQLAQALCLKKEFCAVLYAVFTEMS